MNRRVHLVDHATRQTACECRRSLDHPPFPRWTEDPALVTCRLCLKTEALKQALLHPEQRRRPESGRRTNRGFLGVWRGRSYADVFAEQLQLPLEE